MVGGRQHVVKLLNDTRIRIMSALCRRALRTRIKVGLTAETNCSCQLNIRLEH